MAAPQARGNRPAAAVLAHRARSRRQAQRPPMRLRIILLVVAASSLALVSCLIPLALALRTLPAGRAVNTAIAHVQAHEGVTRTWLLLGGASLAVLTLSV